MVVIYKGSVTLGLCRIRGEMKTKMLLVRLELPLGPQQSDSLLIVLELLP